MSILSSRPQLVQSTTKMSLPTDARLGVGGGAGGGGAGGTRAARKQAASTEMSAGMRRPHWTPTSPWFARMCGSVNETHAPKRCVQATLRQKPEVRPLGSTQASAECTRTAMPALHPVNNKEPTAKKLPMR